MKLGHLFSGLLLTVLVSAHAEAAETLTLTKASAVAFGGKNGDSLAIESTAGKDQAVVLLTPRGENCTLRFPVLVGDTLTLRAATTGGEEAVCDLALTGVVGEAKAEFSYVCRSAPASRDLKCPKAEELAEHPAGTALHDSTTLPSR